MDMKKNMDADITELSGFSKIKIKLKDYISLKKLEKKTIIYILL